MTETMRLEVSQDISGVDASGKGIFWADSAEYDMVGGTRTSKRKHPIRKAEESENGAGEK